jgi:hypothetical protein
VSERDLDVLIEAAVTPYRERDVEGRVVPPPAWWDLSPEAREELYRRQMISRVIEKAFDAEGWSGTVRAVMERIGG